MHFRFFLKVSISFLAIFDCTLALAADSNTVKIHTLLPNPLSNFSLKGACRFTAKKSEFGIVNNKKFKTITAAKRLISRRSLNSFKKQAKKGTAQCKKLFALKSIDHITRDGDETATPSPSPTITNYSSQTATPTPTRTATPFFTPTRTKTPTPTPTSTPTDDPNSSCDEINPPEVPLGSELEERAMTPAPWRYNTNPPAQTGTPTPTPTPSAPPSPAGFSQVVSGTNKILTFTGTTDTEKLEGYTTIPLSISGLENGKSYVISYNHRVQNVVCYNSLQYDYHVANAYASDTKGIYCGQPSAYLVIRKDGAVWGEYIRLTTLPRWDGGYTWNSERDWAQDKVIFRLPKTGAIKLELRLEMKGFHGDFQLDHVAIQKPQTSFESQLDGGEFSTPGKPYSFRDVRVVRTSPKCKAIHRSISSDTSLKVDTALLSFEFRTDPSSDVLETTKDNRVLSRLDFPRGTFEDLTLRKKPSADEAGNVLISNNTVAFKVGPDGMVVGKIKKNAPDVDVMVSGSPNNRSDQSCPDCYKNFYFNQEAGTVFESNLDNYEGFLFSPVFPSQDVTSLKSNAYASAIPAPTPSGPSFSDRYGDWYYKDDYLKNTVERPFPTVSYAPGNWLADPQGPKIPQQQWGIRYTFTAGDEFFLSAFPFRSLDQKAMCSERFQSSLSVDPKLPQSSSNLLDQHLNVVRSNPNFLNILFMNWTRYTKAINPNVPAYYYVEYYLNGTVRTFKYIKPDVSLADCPTSSTFIGQCKRPFQKGGDIHGPYHVSQELDPNGNSEETNVKNYLLSLTNKRSGLPNDPVQDPVFYIGLQFLYTKNPAVILQNLQELWDTYSPYGLKGFYFDGAIPSDALKTREVIIGTRRIVGDNGVIIHHYSKPNELLPQTDHFFVPAYAASINARLLGEGIKKKWDITDSTVNAGQCPKVWGLMYGGKGTVPSSMMPELRGVDFWNASDADFFNNSVSPNLQTKAQLLCGGLVYAPIHNEPLSATSGRKSFAFIEKSRLGINSSTSPLKDKACMPTGPSDPQCPNNGEDGYWTKLQSTCSQ